MNNYKENAFVFSSRLRIWRHIIFWTAHIFIFSFLFNIPGQSIGNMLMLSTLWVPAFILYCYPIMYWMVPSYLLKEKYLQFSVLLLAWAMAGYFLNYIFRVNVLFPFMDLLQHKTSNKNPWAPTSYLSMNVMAGFCCMIALFKYWIKKQKEWMQAEKEKVTAELQLLKVYIFTTNTRITSLSDFG